MTTIGSAKVMEIKANDRWLQITAVQDTYRGSAPPMARYVAGVVN